MARTKQTPKQTPQPSLPAKVPTVLRFPLLVLSSLTLSSVLYTVASSFTAGDLSSVSRRIDDWWQVAGLIGWKITELAVGWWGQYDSVDLASLTVLSHAPHLYLLTTFYGIRPTTMISCLTIDALAAYIPFSLLRDVSATHRSRAPKDAVSNQSVINDLSVRIYTSLLAAGIYSVIVFGSFGSWLPVHLIIHFDGLRDISAAHSAALPFLIFSFFPLGVTAREFLFTTATGAKPDAHDDKVASFNPETATLGQTFMYNIWGHSKRTRTLIQRTVTLVAVTGFYTWLQTFVAIEGAESYGAAGWSAIWAVAATATGVAYWWVGDVEGVSN